MDSWAAQLRVRDHTVGFLLTLGCAAATQTSCTAASPGHAAQVDGEASAQDASGAADLAAALEPIRAAAALPGLAAAVLKGDQVVAIGATGLRKLGDPTPCGPEDQWHLGSNTKAMTATLVGLAVEEGKIQFEDSLAKLFAGETLDPGWTQVTIEDLLRHRGGAPATIPSSVLTAMRNAGAAPDALTSAVLAILAAPPAQQPGTFQYANSGYMIVGAALERIYAQTWEQQMLTRLFAPLGMASCGFGAPGSPTSVNQPWQHKVGTPPIPVPPGPDADNPRALGPAATVHCSLRDWARFIALHVAGERGENRLLKASTIRRLHTPPPGGEYAAGVGVGPEAWAGGMVMGHGGTNLMSYSIVRFAPGKNLAMLVATNVGGKGAEQATYDVLTPLIAAYAN